MLSVSPDWSCPGRYYRQRTGLIIGIAVFELIPDTTLVYESFNEVLEDAKLILLFPTIRSTCEMNSYDITSITCNLPPPLHRTCDTDDVFLQDPRATIVTVTMKRASTCVVVRARTLQFYLAARNRSSTRPTIVDWPVWSSQARVFGNAVPSSGVSQQWQSSATSISWCSELRTLEAGGLDSSRGNIQRLHILDFSTAFDIATDMSNPVQGTANITVEETRSWYLVGSHTSMPVRRIPCGITVAHDDTVHMGEDFFVIQREDDQ